MAGEKSMVKKKQSAKADKAAAQQTPVKHLNLRRKKDLNFVLNDVALEQRGYFVN
jgi:hypothetical protein